MSGVKSSNILQMPARPESSRQDFSLGSRAAETLSAAETPADVFAPDDNSADYLADYTGTKEQNSVPTEGFAFIAVDRVTFSPYQTRSIASEAELEELARSIESKGVLQPILVRPSSEESKVLKYELVAGERRLRAARLVGLAFVPAIVQELEDIEAVQISIIENAQRENLNSIEEALAYLRLHEEFGMNQTEIARAIGKNRSTISNSLRLLQLDDRVIDLLRRGELSAGHGRALLQLDDGDLQHRLARRALRSSLSVHALEKLAAAIHEETEEDDEISEEELKEIASLKRQRTRVSNLLGIEEVDLKFDTQGRRRLNLCFDTEASWKRFMAKIRE
jgi:ParB family chromosome partitioning protein